MKFLSTLLVLGGYVLVYAAVANHGKYATSPWLGVFRDAYGVDAQKATVTTTGGATTTPPTTTTPNIRRRTTPTTSA